jgi:hypothetical protein
MEHSPTSATRTGKVGARASLIFGVMPSGMLRHPLFLSWV